MGFVSHFVLAIYLEGKYRLIDIGELVGNPESTGNLASAGMDKGAGKGSKMQVWAT